MQGQTHPTTAEMQICQAPVAGHTTAGAENLLTIRCLSTPCNEHSANNLYIQTSQCPTSHQYPRSHQHVSRSHHSRPLTFSPVHFTHSIQRSARTYLSPEPYLCLNPSSTTCAPTASSFPRLHLHRLPKTTVATLTPKTKMKTSLQDGETFISKFQLRSPNLVARLSQS